MVEDEVVQHDDAGLVAKPLDDPAVRLGIVSDVVERDVAVRLLPARSNVDLHSPPQRRQQERRVVGDARALRRHRAVVRDCRPRAGCANGARRSVRALLTTGKRAKQLLDGIRERPLDTGTPYERPLCGHARAADFLLQPAVERRDVLARHRRDFSRSLLTLVPGISGGTETYARELCRALASVGELRYRVFLPGIAPDAADGLPSSVVGRYRASRTMPGRIAAMSLAAVRPQPLRKELGLERIDAMHFPLSVMLPSVDGPPVASTIADLQHEEHPEFFGRAELAYRKIVYGRTVRRSRIVITISEHTRQALLERY